MLKWLRTVIVLVLLQGGALTTASAATPGIYETNGIKITVGSTGEITMVSVSGSDSWMGATGCTFTGSEIKGDGIDEAWGSWDDNVTTGTNYTIRHCDFTAIYDGNDTFSGSFHWSYKQKIGSDVHQGRGGDDDYTAPGEFEYNLAFLDPNNRVFPASDTTKQIQIIADKTNNANVTLVVSDPNWMHVTPINWADNTFQLSVDPNIGDRREGTIALGYKGYSRSLKIIQSAANTPEIIVEMQDGTNLIDDIATIDFGDITIGSSSDPIFLTIRNLGAADLTNLGILKYGLHAANFTITGPDVTTLTPGASTTFSITFSPSAAGQRIAAIRIASNDDDEGLFDIEIFGGRFDFKFTSDGSSITITGYKTKPTGTLIIPPTLEGLPVSGIKRYAFSSCDELINLSICYGLSSIEEYAFAYCDALVSVKIPSSITSFGDFVFTDCDELLNVTLAEGLQSIGDRMFLGSEKLSTVEIPSTVRRIGREAFSQCSGLTTMIIPEGVTYIGVYSFWLCENLRSVSLPSGLRSLERGLFADCSKLTSVKIPSSVTNIGADVFSGCTGLTSVSIPTGVESLGAYAFRACRGLTSVSFPAGITSIEYGVFQDCSGLKSVTIPFSVTSIGDYAFSSCGALTNILIPSGVSSIGAKAFSGCIGLTNLSIPAGITSIENHAFEFCNFTSVTIPSNVESIGEYAFAYCHKLKTAVFLGDAPTMGSYAFFYDASGFAINFVVGKSGYSSPQWEGYPASAIPATVELWRLDHFGKMENNGAGANSNDFDNDGLANLLECAFGGNPRVDDAAGVCPSAIFSDGELQISFQCDSYLTNIIYTVQACADPGTDAWENIAVSTGGAVVQPIGSLSKVSDSGAGVRRVTVTASEGFIAEGTGFLRVMVSSQ